MTKDDRPFVTWNIDFSYWFQWISPLCFWWEFVFLVPRNLNLWEFWVPKKYILQIIFWLISTVSNTLNLYMSGFIDNFYLYTTKPIFQWEDVGINQLQILGKSDFYFLQRYVKKFPSEKLYFLRQYFQIYNYMMYNKKIILSKFILTFYNTVTHSLVILN